MLNSLRLELIAAGSLSLFLIAFKKLIDGVGSRDEDRLLQCQRSETVCLTTQRKRDISRERGSSLFPSSTVRPESADGEKRVHGLEAEERYVSRIPLVMMASTVTSTVLELICPCNFYNGTRLLFLQLHYFLDVSSSMSSIRHLKTIPLQEYILAKWLNVYNYD